MNHNDKLNILIAVITALCVLQFYVLYKIIELKDTVDGLYVIINSLDYSIQTEVLSIPEQDNK